MSGNNGLGCMWIGVLVIAAILFAALAFGAPNVGEFGLSWDNSAALAREAQRTERTRIEANRDIRLEEERGETTRQVVGVLAVLGGIAVAGWTIQRVAVAWAARPHRPAVQPPAQIVIMAAPMLEAEPTAFLDWIDQDGYTGWGVKNPRTMDIVPLRLPGNGQRRIERRR